MRLLRGWVYRLYKTSLPAAFAVSLPLLLLVAWFAWSSFAQLDRYRRASGEGATLDLELFQIALHDQIYRDLRRFLLPETPEPAALPTFELWLSNSALDELSQDPIREGKTSYVPATIRKGGVMRDVSVRTRGQRHWHWLGAQKSLKVRIKGELLDGTRVFNLLNDVTPFGLEDDIILGLAREHDLLSPEYTPVRVRLNNADMGVYRYEAQPAEGLLRRAGRLPASIYSGNTDATGPQVGVGELFGNVERWQKTAWRTEEEQHDFTQLRRLLDGLRSSSHVEFRDLAHNELDLDKLARFDALDVAFGGDQHDYVSSHKLLFDPYRGRFEPIAWDFRAFTHDPVFNRAENPLLVRLKDLPEFLWMRDRALYDLLTGAASATEVQARAEQQFERLRPELEADPYWDAYKLLGRASRFHRFMVRPMNTGRWLLSARSELARYSRRTRYLLNHLEAAGLQLSGAQTPHGARLRATVAGHAAYLLGEIATTGPCRGPVRVHADLDGDGVRGPGDPEVARGNVGGRLLPHTARTWTPGVHWAKRHGGRDSDGPIQSERVERSYDYILTASCPLDSASIEAESLVTGALERRDLAFSARPLPDLPPRTAANTVPALAAGEESPHPWTFPLPPAPEKILLGPGPVHFAETQVYQPHQQVRIAAGTHLTLGPGASLVFLGPLLADGTRDDPIQIAAADPTQPFGGLLLLGPGTAGSQLQHLILSGGTHTEYRAVYAPSVLNIYDTRDILLRAVTAREAAAGDDVIHVTYVDRFRLHEVTVRDAPVDGVDIEMSTGDIRGLRVLTAGDECIDLMGSTVRLTDSVLVACASNAISAGEETQLRVQSSVIADSPVGVLAKHSSNVRLSRSLVYRSKQAVRTHSPDAYYEESSTIDAQDLFAIDCDEVSKRAPQTEIQVANLHHELPPQGHLDYVRRQVLDLAAWSEIDTAFDDSPGAER